MSLRVRLVVAFFLLSVVPIGAVTLYTYTTNAAATRDAARREAELLAGELTERMKLVTAQLSQQFERLMTLPTGAPAADPAPATAAASASGATISTAPPAAEAAGAAGASGQVAEQLGEIAMLLNNIEVRGFNRGRGGRPPRGVAGGTGAATPPGYAGPGARGGRAGFPAPPPPASGDADREAPAPPLASVTPPSPPLSGEDGGRLGRPPDAADGPAFGGGRGGDPPAGGVGRRGTGPDEPSDPGRLQIDLAPVRRQLLQEFFPGRERWEQLSPEERELILARVNERMRGIQQGIELLQQKATEQADEARIAAAAAAAAPSPSRPTDTPPATADAQPAMPPRAPVRPPAPEPATTAPSADQAGPLQRQTALSGTRMDVRVVQDGEVIGQVNAEINLPNLLATVFTTTRRDQGEVPFAVDRDGRVYTPSEADGRAIAALDTAAVRADTPAGTTLLDDWVVVTTAGPTGAELKFGIARPLGGALDDLRRSLVRNAALGIGLIGLALIGIVPLSSRLTRNLSRLSEGVNRIAQGDYSARVPVSSTDEVGRLAAAFNQMAADVERHQRAAVAQERLRRELELGRRIQDEMLPRAPLRVGATEIRGVSVPASEVGGDFFNYFPTPSGRIALVVGDVAGKGVGAALLMANIQASLRTRLALGQDLPSLARELDADIGASTPGAVYATLVVGLLDPARGTFDYVNAGHNPPFVLPARGALHRLAATGMPIGLLVGHGYGERQVRLEAGDVLFFYTDGCIEAENRSGEMFGTARLEALLAGPPTGSAADLLVRVERDIVEFRSGQELRDDATMMVVKVG